MARRQPTTPRDSGSKITDQKVTGRHGPIPIRRYEPLKGSNRTRTLVWVHGGAFSHGGLDQRESHAVAVALARRGINVVAVDYRRVPAWSWFRDAPQTPLEGIRYPAPLDDVIDVFHAVSESHANVVLGGASAGACLSAATALRLVHESPTAAPADLILAYGTFHSALPPVSEELRNRVRGLRGLAQFRPETVRRMNHNYAGSRAAMTEPYAFPGGHNLAGMPSALLLDADHDVLRASGSAFGAELIAAGSEIDYRIIHGSTHGFLDRPGKPAFNRAIEIIASRLATASERS